ncbi:MAG: DUF1194 domain-containing protein [Paracoccaceae bacterium]
MFLLRAVAVACLLAPPAGACDLALLLAVDVSGSVSRDEYRIQSDGLAAALRDGLVAEALIKARANVALVQWSGTSRHEVTIPWVAIETDADLEALAGRIEADKRLWRDYSTAIGEALMVAEAQFADVPECKRKVIDVSGDGSSNEGQEPRERHAALRGAGITVNALVIEGSEPDLDVYFWENVIVGEGAFIVTANGFEEYPAAIRRKLIRETTKQVAWLDLGGQ